MFRNQTTDRHLSAILSPLSLPTYRRLLLSTILWQQSLAIWTLTAGWLLLELTDSALTVALLSFWRRAAQLAVGFLAGPIGDRLGRRTAMLVVQGTHLVLFGAILLLFRLDRLAAWQILAAMFLIGITWTIDLPARTALTPDLVGKTRITDAMLLENFVLGLLGSVGPFVAGWLLAGYGPLAGFGLLVTLATVHLFLLTDLARQPIPQQTTATQGTLWQAVQQGIRYICRQRLLLGVTFVSAVLNILIFPSLSLLPVFARDVLASGPVGLGLLNTGYSLGSFVGLYLVHQLRGRLSEKLLFVAGALLECTTVVVFALSPLYPLSWLMLFCAGVGQAGFHTMRSVILLSNASDEMRGRAMSTIVLTQGAGLPGELQTGLLAERMGAPLLVRRASDLIDKYIGETEKN
ncbi:MAG: MFS transporter, partial [Caldilineaceae bacterium]|nr:MFS transporter [Caldilineaceae bacterium]